MCWDLLEKSYLCGINNNKSQCNENYHLVVICLKSLTFVVSITTYQDKLRSCQLVVICLKSLTFVVSITTAYTRGYSHHSCDLLEKSYLCGINNNTA